MRSNDLSPSLCRARLYFLTEVKQIENFTEQRKTFVLFESWVCFPHFALRSVMIDAALWCLKASKNVGRATEYFSLFRYCDELLGELLESL